MVAGGGGGRLWTARLGGEGVAGQVADDSRWVGSAVGVSGRRWG
jgi:hypothetical protein